MIRRGERLQHCGAAVLLGGEKLDGIEAERHGLFHLAGGRRAGTHGNALFPYIGDKFRLKSRTHDEFCTRRNRGVRLRFGDNGAGADCHVGHLAGQRADGLCGSRGPEGDLDCGDTAFLESLGERQRVVRVLDCDNRNNADAVQFFDTSVHFAILPAFFCIICTEISVA